MNQITLTSGSIPEWNEKGKYMTSMLMDHTSISGTIPSWTKWKWPYQLTIARNTGGLSGTIPEFTSAKCATLDRLFLFSMGLTGTMPNLPKQYIVSRSSRIYLHQNKLHGTFP